MKSHKSMLCIGGPYDGQRYAILHETGFRVPVKMETSAGDPAGPDYAPNKPVAIEFSDYRAEEFHTPQGDVSFWVPAGQTPLETITILLETYERARGKGLP